MKISSSSASIAASPSGGRRRGSATGAAAPARPLPARPATTAGSTSNGVSPATAFSNGTSRNMPSAWSNVKRSLAASKFCASMSMKKPSAPTFCAMFCSDAASASAAPPPAASTRTASLTCRPRASPGPGRGSPARPATGAAPDRSGPAPDAARRRRNNRRAPSRPGASRSSFRRPAPPTVWPCWIWRDRSPCHCGASGGVSPAASASRRAPTTSACSSKSAGSWRTWSRPCSTNSIAVAISMLNWSLRPEAIESLAARPSSRSSCASAGAPSWSLAPARVASA